MIVFYHFILVDGCKNYSHKTYVEFYYIIRNTSKQYSCYLSSFPQHIYTSCCCNTNDTWNVVGSSISQYNDHTGPLAFYFKILTSTSIVIFKDIFVDCAILVRPHECIFFLSCSSIYPIVRPVSQKQGRQQQHMSVSMWLWWSIFYILYYVINPIKNIFKFYFELCIFLLFMFS